MKLRAFLSHKREQQAPVTTLRDELRFRGIGGWKDTEDLPLGQRTPRRIRKAIRTQTGGFIWWGTKRALDSDVMNRVEVPVALSRKRRSGTYPLVPLFVDLDPKDDAGPIADALGSRRTKRLLDLNGLVRRSHESLEDFARRAARRYAADAIRSVAGAPVTAGFTALRDPRPDRDLTFDWRPLFDPETRHLDVEGLPRIVDALDEARLALQGGAPQPEIEVDLVLPLPLAYVVGYRWRITTGIHLSFIQRTGGTERLVDGDGPIANPIAPPDLALAGDGPAVLAVSTIWDIAASATRYAEGLPGSSVISLHVPRVIEPAEIRGLARTVGTLLKQLADSGVEKHLLLRGPESLAALIGAGANACGPTVLPFWNGAEYVSPIEVG
jgi:hypothetical protein